ncbi:MAG: cytochrome c-type biogenesis protein, partial [Flavobacteriales bacterium]
TYEMVMDGQTDQQIRTYMIDRYGDFVTYRPPVRPSTWILWFFPPVLLVVVLVGWLVLVHRRQRQNATQQLSAVEQQRLQALLQSSAAPSADAGQSRVGQSDVGGAHDA